MREKPQTYEVEKILDSRKGKRLTFLIKWKGYEEPTWERAENCDCPDAIAEYYESKKMSRERSITVDSTSSASKKRKRRKDWSEPRRMRKRLARSSSEESSVTSNVGRKRKRLARSSSEESSFTSNVGRKRPKLTRRASQESSADEIVLPRSLKKNKQPKETSGEEDKDDDAKDKKNSKDAAKARVSSDEPEEKEEEEEREKTLTDEDKAKHKQESDLRVLRDTLHQIESDVLKCAVIHSTRVPGLPIFDHTAYVNWLNLNGLQIPVVKFTRSEPEYIFNREVDRVLACSNCNGGFFLIKTKARRGEGAVPVENLVFAVSSELGSKLLPCAMELYSRRALDALARAAARKQTA